MKFGFYEPHTMLIDKLPFIFHRDTVRKQAIETHSPAHWHRNIEILFFLSGEGQVLCDTQVTQVSPGDIFVVNANSMHCITTDSEVRYYCLIIDGSFCTENEIDAENILLQNHICDAHAESLYAQIAKAYADRNAYYNACVRSSVLSLLVYLACNYTLTADNTKRRAGSKAVNNIKTALGYIHERYTQKLSITQVSESVGLSQFHFSREFKKVTGVSFVGYVNYLRCENARKLLQSGKCTVAEAAVQSGFENFSYFSKTFKTFYGHLPNTYIP